MSEESEHKSDCYSQGERGWMEFGQRSRAYVLRPLLVLLTGLRITPDAVTLFAALTGLGFVPFWLMGQKAIALVVLWSHVLLDGLDGPLARHQHVASSRGSFTDTFADQVVVTAVAIAWMMEYPLAVNICAGAVYIFLYALVVAMAMVRNALNAPYSWLVRPRFFVYAVLGIDAWFGSNWTLVVLVFCDVLLSLKSASGFLKLRSRLPGPEQS